MGYLLLVFTLKLVGHSNIIKANKGWITTGWRVSSASNRNYIIVEISNDPRFIKYVKQH